MKVIKIASLFYCDNTIEHIASLLRFNPEEHNMKFVYDDEHPDYVVVMNIVYESKSIYNRFLKYWDSDCIFIYFAGECSTPDLNIFDYAVAFDRHLSYGDRIARLSTCRFYSVSIFKEFLDENITPDIIHKKTKFCNFMYSHSYIYRDRLFNKISEYKKVDSLGKHLNNTGSKNTRHVSDWRKLSIEDRIPYKFSIASENARFEGYISEKLLSCLEAHTVPIYWGDPSIGEEFNTKAFINCSDYKDFDEVLERIKEIDNDDDLFYSILKEPWQTEEQKQKTAELDAKYDQWILNVFSQDKENARRRPIGTYPDVYRKWFLKRYNKPLKVRIKRIVVKVMQNLKLK